MRRSSVVPIALLVAALALSLAPLPARSQLADVLPFVSSITTVPAQPCESIPTRIAIQGVLPSTCGGWLGHRGQTIYIADPNPECAGCPAVAVPWADTLDVGLLRAGSHSLTLTMAVIDSVCATPPDTTFHYARIAFEVHSECAGPPPPPFDPMTYVDRVLITSVSNPSSGIICEGDSILIRLSGTFPDDCHSLRRIRVLPSPETVIPVPILIQLVFDNGCCVDRPCYSFPAPWQAVVVLPTRGPGPQDLTLRGVEVCCTDSIRPEDPHGSRNFDFTVMQHESCGVAPPPLTCLYPSWLHETGRCDAFISKTGGPAVVTGTVYTTVALAGIQGEVRAFENSGQWPLFVSAIEPTGPAAGMHLTWEPIAGGAKFVLWADQGAPIPPTFDRPPSQFLKISWRPGIRDTRASGIMPPELRWYVGWGSVFGSDVDGNLVPLCPIRTDFAVDAAIICAGEPAACDFNGDAHSDVRDLVLMAHCLVSPRACPWDTTGLDCDADADFDFDDLICCARNVLGIPPCPDCPDDSVRAEPGIAFSFGTPVQTPAGIEIPVHIQHAGLIGAARFGFSLPPELAGRAWIDMNASSWLPITRGNGNGIEFGMIHLPSIAAVRELPYVDATLHIAVDSGTRPTGQIALDQVQISGPDGVMLKTDLGSPVVRLGPGLGVSLSQARPNPFVTSTTFRLTLDAAVDAAEIGVYDLSGRRVATLHKGALPVGSHPFTWNGRVDGSGKAKAGVYFVRATAGSHTTNQKLVMLKD